MPQAPSHLGVRARHRNSLDFPAGRTKTSILKMISVPTGAPRLAAARKTGTVSALPRHIAARERLGEAANRLGLVVENLKNRVQLGNLQQVLDALGQIEQL